ncbi:nucleotidyltransferase family protein [Methanoculleus sp.]|uniref:nucleotidyltransferase family protein n=1 Tax=Methanoculleus sp. TaxID=90427 RepID=UPI0025FC64F7|nr:nucleotidyltransferase family protein [Methanoculleus sp.]MCK9319872.1 nucleotidyltransferase family protein [Methanoculleus sp.]MDD2255334.1 nucleotidyltransferase family protein [Methanoculleus sp.]MDD2788543.1 nucleotidyltransferase family protein [Methanoculleus sp.]MDD3217363.1 nucleotidyltransferase family protein [Methanoculleus sp.]MDD4472230.1 nucleotidyltransferase family protein [Methanoculleus sp.]
MSVTQDLIQKKRSRILAIAGRHGATNLRIFGSVARGEVGPESDLDLLVDLEPGRSLLDHIALIQDLEEALGCRVDVVTETALKERYKKRVLNEAVPL